MKEIIVNCKECDEPLTVDNFLPEPYEGILECNKCGYPHGSSDYVVIVPSLHVKCDICGLETPAIIGKPFIHDCIEEHEDTIAYIWNCEGESEDYKKAIVRLEELKHKVAYFKKRGFIYV